MRMSLSSPSYQAPPHGFRTFLVLWVSQSVSVFGSALTFFALTIWLTQVLYPMPEQKPQLAVALSATSLAFGIPVIFGAPIAGAWADRHDRKRTMFVMDVGNGIVSLTTALLIVSGVMQLWMLVAILVVSSILTAFHSSAFDTSYAMIVPEKQLPRANGMMQTMWSLSGILSPALAATIISLPGLARQGLLPSRVSTYLGGLHDGSPLAITIDAITFFLAATTLLFLYIPSPKRTDLRDERGKQTKSLWADVKEGALYIWHRRPLLWLLGTFTVANFAFAPMQIFVPLILKYNLAADWAAHGFTFETAYALLSTFFGLGGVIGGVFISVWGGLKSRRVYGVVLALIVSGLAEIVFGLAPVFYVVVAVAFLSSSVIPIMNSHSQTIWQTQTPRELQGRVFSVRRLIAQFSGPLSTAIAGVVGGLFNPGVVLAVLGGILVVFCMGQMFNPYLLRVEDRDYLEELAAQATAARG
jgi:MFS family permease